MSKIAKFAATLGFVVATAGIAQAMPASVPSNHAASLVTEASFGCGRNMHPNKFGRCVPNGPVIIDRHAPLVRPMIRPVPLVARPVCPRGTRLSPNGRRCISRF
jgi:hypothetical protein